MAGLEPGSGLTLSVPVAQGGPYVLTVVGLVAGARTVQISVNGGPPQPLVLNGSSFESPLVARSVVVWLKGRTNVISFSGTAPDLDRITLSRLPEDD